MGKNAQAPAGVDPNVTIPLQAKYDKEAFDQSLAASRTNQVTPTGTQSWTQTPGKNGGPATWTLNTNLSPSQQAIFNADQASQLKQSGLLDKLTDRVGTATAKPVDYSGIQGDANSALQTALAKYTGKLDKMDPMAFSQKASDAAYGQATRYLDPQVQQTQQALEARLGEQGFVPGTPGYKQAMQNFQDTNNRAYADARDRATTAGFSVGKDTFASDLAATQTGIGASMGGANFSNESRQQQIAQLLAERNQPLNELNALRTGTQVQTPTFNSGSTSAPNMQSPDVLASYQSKANSDLANYNAQVQSNNATLSSLGQLGLAAGMFKWSDARLKTDINLLRVADSGVKWYTYLMDGEPQIGVLAQEVQEIFPEAVSEMPNGYLMVNYAKVH